MFGKFVEHMECVAGWRHGEIVLCISVLVISIWINIIFLNKIYAVNANNPDIKR